MHQWSFESRLLTRELDKNIARISAKPNPFRLQAECVVTAKKVSDMKEAIQQKTWISMQDSVMVQCTAACWNHNSKNITEKY